MYLKYTRTMTKSVNAAAVDRKSVVQERFTQLIVAEPQIDSGGCCRE
jgi:hypothetical protein